jgi:hypothetical protein
MSAANIDKGARWGMALASELQATEVGIICVTRENVEVPWLLFEAGALSKSVDAARVCTYLYDLPL